jgi:hypothetical protein
MRRPSAYRLMVVARGALKFKWLNAIAATSSPASGVLGRAPLGGNTRSSDFDGSTAVDVRPGSAPTGVSAS